jgi:hypothetical protein
MISLVKAHEKSPNNPDRSQYKSIILYIFFKLRGLSPQANYTELLLYYT